MPMLQPLEVSIRYNFTVRIFRAWSSHTTFVHKHESVVDAIVWNMFMFVSSWYGNNNRKQGDTWVWSDPDAKMRRSRTFMCMQLCCVFFSLHNHVN